MKEKIDYQYMVEVSMTSAVKCTCGTCTMLRVFGKEKGLV